jgi:hypothetical protein
VANAAGTEPDENFALCGRRQVELRQLKRSADPLEDGGANLQCPSSVDSSMWWFSTSVLRARMVSTRC